MTLLQAHRGVSSEYPENTMAAFRASVEQGYGLIELDPKHTADGKFVILHDKTLTRTARDADGNAPDYAIKDITLEKAQEYEYGSWFAPEFRGEPIPLLSDVLDFAEQHPDIPIKIDNVWEKFEAPHRNTFLKEIESRGDKVANIGFTCRTLECLEIVAKRFPNATLHYDGTDLTKEGLDKVAEIAKGHRLVIWVCYDGNTSKWFKGPRASRELCDFVRQYGELGIWILSDKKQFERTLRKYNPDIIETTGHIKPEWIK